MKLLIPPPIVALCSGLLIWALARALPFMTINFMGQGYLALMFLIVGAVIDVLSVVNFLCAKTTVNPLKPGNTSKLVITGFYHLTRNPMYLGLLFLLIGWALWLGNLAAFLVLAGFVWFITTFQIKPEEAALRKKFGVDYEAYCQRVRRWI